MKIYFAGSIRGGRADVGLYQRLEIPIWQVNASVRRLKEKKWI